MSAVTTGSATQASAADFASSSTVAAPATHSADDGRSKTRSAQADVTTSLDSVGTSAVGVGAADLLFDSDSAHPTPENHLA